VIRSSRRSAGRCRAVVAALIAAGGTLLAGCQTGQQAETAEQRPTIDGTFAQVGSLALRDVRIEYPERGSWAQGSDARLQLIVVNQGREADQLVEVRTDVADGVTFSTEGSGGAAGEDGASPSAEPSETGAPTAATLTATSPSTPTPTASPSGTASASPDESTPTPTPTPTEEAETSIPIPPVAAVSLRDDGPEILLTGLTRVLRPAQVVPVTFVFAEAGEVTVQVAVATPIEEIAPAPTVPTDHEAEADE
jgi:copper(I)-binding protein